MNVLVSANFSFSKQRQVAVSFYVLSNRTIVKTVCLIVDIKQREYKIHIIKQ